jgi:glutaredoxin 3
MITIFTTKTCAYCPMVKKYLDMKHQTYEVVDVTDDMEARDRLFKATGALTVPITQIGDKYVIGPNYGKLAEALSGIEQ